MTIVMIAPDSTAVLNKISPAQSQSRHTATRLFFIPIKQIKHEKELEKYGIFRKRNRHIKNPRNRLGRRFGGLGSYQPFEGYGNDNPGAKSQGMKQLMAGGGVALIGFTLVPLLANLFS